MDEIDPRVDELPYARYFEQSRNGIPSVTLMRVMELKKTETNENEGLLVQKDPERDGDRPY